TYTCHAIGVVDAEGSFVSLIPAYSPLPLAQSFCIPRLHNRSSGVYIPVYQAGTSLSPDTLVAELCLTDLPPCENSDVFELSVELAVNPTRCMFALKHMPSKRCVQVTACINPSQNCVQVFL